MMQNRQESEVAAMIVVKLYRRRSYVGCGGCLIVSSRNTKSKGFQKFEIDVAGKGVCSCLIRSHGAGEGTMAIGIVYGFLTIVGETLADFAV